MKQIKEIHVLKAIATLLAMQQYKGPKNDWTIVHCQWAADELVLSAAIEEGLHGAAESAKTGNLKTLQVLSIAKAAKLLGIYPDEPAGLPTDQWLDTVRGKIGDTGWDTWWHRFSKN